MAGPASEERCDPPHVQHAVGVLQQRQLARRHRQAGEHVAAQAAAAQAHQRRRRAGGQRECADRVAGGGEGDGQPLERGPHVHGRADGLRAVVGHEGVPRRKVCGHGAGAPVLHGGVGEAAFAAGRLDGGGELVKGQAQAAQVVGGGQAGDALPAALDAGQPLVEGGGEEGLAVEGRCHVVCAALLPCFILLLGGWVGGQRKEETRWVGAKGAERRTSCTHTHTHTHTHTQDE